MRYAGGAGESQSGCWSKHWLARFCIRANRKYTQDIHIDARNYITYSLSLSPHNQLLPLAAPHSLSPLMISLAATHLVSAAQSSRHTQGGQGEMIKKRPENKNNRATVRWKLKRPTKITRLSLTAHPLFFALALLSPFPI
jgi:hypothetical protein